MRFPGSRSRWPRDALPDVLVLRSLTKTWALAGLRVGYALGAPELLARLTARRAHWPVGTLQLTAIAACCAAGPSQRRRPVRGGWRSCAPRWWPAWRRWAPTWSMAGPRSSCSACPTPLGYETAWSDKGIAIRRCDTFVGLDDRYLRAAVRREWPLLVQAIAEVLR